MKTVVGIFSSQTDAQQTADELMQAIGVGPDAIDMLTDRDLGNDTETLGELSRSGVPDDVARRYVEGLHGGGIMETVRLDDASVPRALEIMNRHTRALSEPAQSEAQATGPTGSREESPKLSVVEEQLEIGKRMVERGAVRARTKISSKPVGEDVQLREEKIDVERRPVDRPIEAGDKPFEEKTIELVERGEEPVVAKQARIVEEVELKKQTSERTQHVADTVRKTDVEIERVPFDKEKYRGHFAENYGKSGEDLGTYEPAYRFGSDLREDERYAQGDWSRAESSAKRDWEQKNPGTWERFKAAIKHAFEGK